ncbi:glycosyltransferase family 9 protein [Hymenobacter ginsengisoli]|uniref:Glycosyltransferase family 9 protein n=1 Tax=Hymenobacter ginsengisoli TaxID=1051626 RepID=A0ABP8QE05_9BACT|nr:MULTISPECIES: glycosyltransferase family 9 protein [unclassified Hymenobacter]MBO2031365.1 glycosyltransferase family 9 protein [Hymenobacter sp. BT559]
MSKPTFLISRTDAIGDVVLTLPVAGWLKQHYPDCRVVLIGRAYTAAVAAACPWVDDFLNADELWQLPESEQVAQLQSQTATAIIHVFPNKRLARLAKLARIPMRIGTRNRVFHWLTCNQLVALSRRHSPLHETQLNLQLLALLGYREPLALKKVAQLVRLAPAAPLRSEYQQLLAARQPGQLNVILHPRSRGSAREWGLAHFSQLARLLYAAGHRVFISGTAAEGEELAEWLRENAAFFTADLTGQLALPEFIAFIAAADGLVAGSTGPLHLAAALGRHALGLYPPIKPMHPGRWGPLGPHAEYLVFDRPNCQDCRARPTACTCIKAIEAATVAGQIAHWQPLPTT